LNSSAIQAADAKCRAAGLTQEPYLKACILDVAVTGDAGFANASVQPHADHTVHDMVEKIRAGEHAAMPSAERSSIPIQGLTGQAIITIKNSTGYELSIFFDGPVSRKVTLAPGATQDVGLIPGMFHVAGRVAAAKILPFYGEETYQGSKYTVTFYISR
jgi:hypothetical protein